MSMDADQTAVMGERIGAATIDAAIVFIPAAIAAATTFTSLDAAGRERVGTVQDAQLSDRSPANPSRVNLAVINGINAADVAVAADVSVPQGQHAGVVAPRPTPENTRACSSAFLSSRTFPGHE